MTNLLDKDNVFTSKQYVKGITSFPTPHNLLNPLLPILQDTGGTLELVGEDKVENRNEDGSGNISFGRVNLTAKYAIDPELKYSVGVLAAYNLTRPVFKIYQGVEVSACTNLCVFGADQIHKFEASEGFNIDIVRSFLADLSGKIQRSIEVVNRLKAAAIQPSQIPEIVGRMLLASQDKEKKFTNGVTSVLDATRLLTDTSSKYFFGQPGFSQWHLYNAMTESFAQKVSFIDIPEKTRDAFAVMNLSLAQLN